MIDIRSLDDISILAESVDLECKLAAGPDGRGKLPDDFWPLNGHVMAHLKRRFGPAFEAMSREERLILATAAIEHVVNHQRLAEISELHPHDLSLILRKLVRDGFLEAGGRAPVEDVKRIVQSICAHHYVTVGILATLLHRTEHYLRHNILNPLVNQKLLLRAFPKTPNDPRQAYTSATPDDAGK